MIINQISNSGLKKYPQIKIKEIKTYMHYGSPAILSVRIALPSGQELLFDNRYYRRHFRKIDVAISRREENQKLTSLRERIDTLFASRLMEQDAAIEFDENDFLIISPDSRAASELPTDEEITMVADVLQFNEYERQELRATLNGPKYGQNNHVSNNAETLKRITHDIKEEILYEILMEEFFEARKHKRSTYDEASFELCLFRNIYSLTRSIITHTYAPSRSMSFVVFRPVTREIFAAPFRDRVIHHLLFDWCYPWWSRHFIYDSYSCQKGKGTALAVKRCDHMMRACSNNYQEKTWIFKFDIKSFFMRMPRPLLYDSAVWGLEREFASGGWLYTLLKYLWFQITLDDPALRAVKRGEKANWGSKSGLNSHGKRCLPFEKSLFNQPLGIGIVIGNLTSQLLSNIFLNQLDRFISFDLGFKYYGRYVDDFYIYVTDKDKKRLSESVVYIRAFLSSLGLQLHPKKSYCQTIDHGVEFIGARIYPYRILPSRRLVRNFKNACLKFATGFSNKESIISYLGSLYHYKSKKLIQKVFDHYGFEYRPGPANPEKDACNP